MSGGLRPDTRTGVRAYRFGSSVLDVRARELTVDGAPVELEPRTFDVLRYLIEHRDRTVPKEELLDSIWGDRFVGESAMTSQIKHARSAIADDGRTQAMIRTVHRVGYRFVAPVEEVGQEPEAPPGQAAPGASAAFPARSPVPSASWATPATRRVLGRDDDLCAVDERVGANRLVTVTGSAGVGKTSLALALAERHRAAAGTGDAEAGDADGGHAAAWWFCDLAETRDPDTLAHVVLAAVGEAQHGDAGPTESLVRVLEPRSDVLVLDNCEHVLDAARALADRVLNRCRWVRIVATSRQPLDLPDESVYALEPLDVDAAVAVFVARAHDAGASVDGEDATLAELCRRLDGIPLALELAAARARLLQPREMLDLLDDRFRLLRRTGAGARGERSLHAAIASSWDALDAHEQALLARLAVFVGTFTLDDARAVAMPVADPLDAVDALERLVRRSLVVVGAATAGRSTFRLLESVRDFAGAQLPDVAGVRRAHVAHFTDVAERLDAACQTDRIDGALGQMRAAWTNLRAAVGYAADGGDTTSVRRIVRAAAQYADLYAAHEVGDWAARAGVDDEVADAAVPVDTVDGDDDVALAAAALSVRARTFAHQGHLDRARRLADRALRLHESHTTVLTLAWCAYYTGELDLVVELAPRLSRLSRSDRGFDRAYAEGFDAMVSGVRQERAISTTTVDPTRADEGVLGAFDTLTEGVRLCAADPERAAELLEAVVDASIRRDYRLLLGAAASTLTQITLPARPPDQAMATLRRTLRRYRERSMWNLISADIVMAARLLADADMPELAGRLIGARLASGYASGLSEVLSLLVQEDLAARLGDAYQPLVDQGRAWRPPEAAAMAIDGLTRALDGRVS